mgnify:FL=1|jgi:predicted MFS family arabinose efflux permease
MDWTILLAIGLFAFAWLTMIYQAQKDSWDTSRTFGMFVFLIGATCGVFLDNLLSAESSLLPWIEPIAAVIMLVGLFIAWIWRPERDAP